MILLIWTAESRPIFWLAANIAGLCLGASQSAGRALVGFFTPPLRYAEFFWSMGPSCEIFVDNRPNYIWNNKLVFKRQPSPCNVVNWQLFYNWSDCANECRCAQGSKIGITH